MYGAAEHAAAFQDNSTFWADVVKKNKCDNQSFQSGLILSSYGKALRDQGKKLESDEMFRRSAECKPLTPDGGGNYAASLVDKATAPQPLSAIVGIGGIGGVGRRLPVPGWFAKANAVYRDILAADPTQTNAGLSVIRANFAWMLILSFQNDPSAPIQNPQDPRLIEAEAVARKSVELQPFRADSLNVLATALFYRGDAAGAERVLRRALELDPGHSNARQNLAKVLEMQRRAAEAAAIRNPPQQP
jgi:tetratricopeptide (TPR) repeat protein